MYVSLLVRCHSYILWPPVLPLNLLIYFDITFATVMRLPAPCRLLTFHVPNLMSIFLSWGRLYKESAQVQGLLWHFEQTYFYGEDLLAPRPTLKLWDTALIGCPRLLIRYIHSYLTYLEAVSSIRNLRFAMSCWQGTHQACFNYH
jgi:hypothetical protein